MSSPDGMWLEVSESDVVKELRIQLAEALEKVREYEDHPPGIGDGDIQRIFRERDAALAKVEEKERMSQRIFDRLVEVEKERDALKLQLRSERQHEDDCPQDSKACLCCPCVCPTRDELKSRLSAAEAREKALREAAKAALEWFEYCTGSDYHASAEMTGDGCELGGVPVEEVEPEDEDNCTCQVKVILDIRAALTPMESP